MVYAARQPEGKRKVAISIVRSVVDFYEARDKGSEPAQ